MAQYGDSDNDDDDDELPQRFPEVQRASTSRVLQENFPLQFTKPDFHHESKLRPRSPEEFREADVSKMLGLQAFLGIPELVPWSSRRL